VIHQNWLDVRGRFDIITYHDVIEHVQDPTAELLRLHRYLRPEGLLVLDTPDADDREFAERGLDWHHLKPIEHLWYFTERSLGTLLSKTGYLIEQIDRPIPGKIVAYSRRQRTRRPKGEMRAKRAGAPEGHEGTTPR
jgi:SAM-dependent methyltransferase